MADPDSRFYQASQAPRLRERILSIYQSIDGFVGQVLSRVDADGATDLLVVSDHGFGSTKSWFNVNRWLEREGHLFLKPLAGLRKRLFYEVMKVNDSSLVKAVLPDSLGGAIRGRVRSGRSVFKTDLDRCIDWRLTRAFFASIPAQGIYINIKRGGVGTVEPGEEHEKVRNKIRHRLLLLTDPRDGKPLVDQVWLREELYHGPKAYLAPDLIFVAREYSVLGRELLGTRG
ncbi:unnamed protein product, partial [marine sediment metagenome]